MIMTSVAASITHAAPTTTTVSTSTASAPTTAAFPDYLPIESMASLKAYALGAGKEGSMHLYGNELLSFNGEVRSIYVSGQNANNIVKSLSTATGFKVRTTDPTKPLYVYGRISNSDGYELFQSYSEYVSTAANGNGGLSIVNTKLTYRLAWQIPLPRIDGVTNAYIQYEDTNGQQWTQELFVSNGSIFIPPNYTGKNATLIAGRYTQTGGYDQIAYDFGTGANIPGTSIAGNVTSAIENHLNASDKGMASSGPLLAVGIMTPAPNGNWGTYSAPTATFNVTLGAGQTRVCTAVFKIPAVTSSPNTELDGITAFAQDSEHVDVNSTFEELSSVSITKVRSGSEWAVTVTWYLHNNANEPDGTNWYCYLVIPKYETLQKPHEPYYQG